MASPGFRSRGLWRGEGAPSGAAGGHQVPAQAKGRLQCDRQIICQAARSSRLRHPALRRGKPILPLRRPPRAPTIPSAKRESCGDPFLGFVSQRPAGF